MEWLANVSIKWVLVAVGLLLVARTALTHSPRGRLGLAAARELLDAGLIATVVVFLLVRPHFLQAYFIPSESMHPTLVESDRILVNKLIYRFISPRRGEILVFRPPEAAVPDQKDYIKRVVGLPGETLEVQPERVLVDGRTLMRLTSASASETLEETYATGASLGFTYPLHGGGAMVSHGKVIISGGIGPDLEVACFGPRDVVRQADGYVSVNNRVLLAPAFGTIQASSDLEQWGGEPGLQGTVYTVDGTPRLILVRGRELRLDPGHVLINGRRLEEDYVAEPARYALPPVRLAARQYFVMGDNRNRSFDSHVWGPLPQQRIIGRAEILFWPWNRAHFIHLNGNR